MNRKLAMASVSVLLTGLLTACGGSSGGGNDTDAYCDSLKSAKDAMSQLQGATGTDLEKAFDQIDELADEAPDAVEADWEKIDDAVEAIKDALDKAGVKLSDLDKIEQGQIPKGLDMSKLQQLSQDLQKLSTTDLKEAGDNIAKHAKDECGIDLNDSTSTS